MELGGTPGGVDQHRQVHGALELGLARLCAVFGFALLEQDRSSCALDNLGRQHHLGDAVAEPRLTAEGFAVMEDLSNQRTADHSEPEPPAPWPLFRREFLRPLPKVDV